MRPFYIFRGRPFALATETGSPRNTLMTVLVTQTSLRKLVYWRVTPTTHHHPPTPACSVVKPQSVNPTICFITHIGKAHDEYGENKLQISIQQHTTPVMSWPPGSDKMLLLSHGGCCVTSTSPQCCLRVLLNTIWTKERKRKKAEVKIKRDNNNSS